MPVHACSSTPHFKFKCSLEGALQPICLEQRRGETFCSILSFLHRTLHFQTSEGASHHISIRHIKSFGKKAKRHVYMRTHKHVSTDTLENSDKKLTEHKNTFSLKINPRTGCLQLFPYLNKHLLCYCLSNRNILLYLCPANLFPI